MTVILDKAFERCLVVLNVWILVEKKNENMKKTMYPIYINVLRMSLGWDANI